MSIGEDTYITTQRPKGNAKKRLQNSFEHEDLRLLSSCVLYVETYAFIYPSLLLDLPEGYDGVESGEIEVIHCAGVQNADDFTFLSPLNLSLASGIAPTKIAALYHWAEEMIAKVHEEQKESIAELKALRNMLK